MSIKALMKNIKRAIKGSYQLAIDEGLHAEEGVSVMGGVNFGSEPYLITLRRQCRISFAVSFITHDGGTWAFRDYLSDYQEIIKFGSIEVGEGAFVGANSTIMPGVKIGHHSVVGVGSIVTKSIPPETVWAGVPARQICTLEEYAKRCYEKMPQAFDLEVYRKDKKAYLLELMSRGEI